MARTYAVVEPGMVVRYRQPGLMNKGMLFKGQVIASIPGYVWIEPLEDHEGKSMIGMVPETVPDGMVDSVVINHGGDDGHR
jgi:hypothetical protein